MQRSASRASTSPSATPSAPGAEARSTSSSTPGRSRASSPRACSRPSSAGARTRPGCPRTATATRPAARRRSTSSSPAPTRGCAPGRPTAGRNTAFSSRTTRRSRSPTTSPCAAGRQGPGLPPDLPLRLPPLQRRGAVAARDVRQGGRRRSSTSSTRRDRRRHRRARRAALRPREERLLVRLAALDRGDAALAPYQNATGPAGDSAVLAGMVWALENPQAGHRRGRRDGLHALPRGADALSRPGRSAPTPTGRRSTDRWGCSPRTSTSTGRISAGFTRCARSLASSPSG
jgi:hypothetical protein